MKKLFFVLILSVALINTINAQKSDTKDNKSELDPGACIAGKTQGEISKSEMIEAKGLSLIDKYKTTYHIIFFKMTIVDKAKGDKGIYELENHDNEKFTEGMINAISNASPGSKIFIEYISVADKTNLVSSIKHLKPLSLVLK